MAVKPSSGSVRRVNAPEDGGLASPELPSLPASAAASLPASGAASFPASFFALSSDRSAEPLSELSAGPEQATRPIHAAEDSAAARHAERSGTARIAMAGK
jgi:hypothetical protein